MPPIINNIQSLTLDIQQLPKIRTFIEKKFRWNSSKFDTFKNNAS